MPAALDSDPAPYSLPAPMLVPSMEGSLSISALSGAWKGSSGSYWLWLSEPLGREDVGDPGTWSVDEEWPFVEEEEEADDMVALSFVSGVLPSAAIINFPGPRPV